jgi:N-acetylglucosamine-6-phosphate deacetylase
MTTAYTNATIYTGQSIETGNAVLVNNHRIEGIVPQKEIPSHYQQEDLEGKLLAPAFIDLQIYGGNRKLFSQELSIESLEATYEYCLAGGCTQFMITMATNTIGKFLQGIEVAKAYQHQGGKGLLGVHLEGPYINYVKRGAHLAECVKVPTTQEINMLLEKGNGVFKMMTLAPEQCPPKIVDLLIQGGIMVSAGHSNATYKQATEAFNKGIPLATHLYNAMSPFQHREPGMVGAIFDHPKVKSSVVCDGVHVNYTAIKIAKQLMKERLFLITDAVAEALIGEYKHIYKNDRYDLPDGTLSGSALTMVQSVKNAVNHVGIPMEEALRMASTYPAAMLTERKLGLIAQGYEADLVVLDEALNVLQVIPAGN